MSNTDMINRLRARYQQWVEDKNALIRELEFTLPDPFKGHAIGEFSSDGIDLYIPATSGGDLDFGLQSGGGYVKTHWREASSYFQNPWGFAAAFFDLSEDEYREWLATDGTPLCACLTRRGLPCKNAVAAGQQYPGTWKTLHRQAPCTTHDRSKV